MNNATLKKLSEMLGLSISTVSRALKDHPDISDKTKLRVKELANALDYEPNANAINLRTSKNNLFGLIVPSISNFFYDSFIAAVEEECRKKNYSMLILQSGDDVFSEQESIKLCRQNRVAGLFACITSATIDIELYKKLADYYNLYSRYQSVDGSFGKSEGLNETLQLESKIFNAKDLSSLNNYKAHNFYDLALRTEEGKQFEHISTDKQTLNLLYLKFSNEKERSLTSKTFLGWLKGMAVDLLSDLKKEYHLE